VVQEALEVGNVGGEGAPNGPREMAHDHLYSQGSGFEASVDLSFPASTSGKDLGFQV
jgi:hypothetical protein